MMFIMFQKVSFFAVNGCFRIIIGPNRPKSHGNNILWPIPKLVQLEETLISVHININKMQNWSKPGVNIFFSFQVISKKLNLDDFFSTSRTLYHGPKNGGYFKWFLVCYF